MTKYLYCPICGEKYDEPRYYLTNIPPCFKCQHKETEMFNKKYGIEERVKKHAESQRKSHQSIY